MAQEQVKLADNKIKCLSIRDFTLSIGKTLLEGGEVVIYKGREPYRYMNIRPIQIARGGLTSEEIEERRQESQSVQKEKLLVERE
jgi:hypothetical protein